MKTKPVSHKNENTFKFQTFGERLNNIDIDYIRKFSRTAESPDDANTFFQRTVEEWNELNYTQDYDSLVSEIGFEITTLKQIVFRKDELAAILLKRLEDANNMALDATLEFVVALAQDLQFEFYPLFPKFFEVLTHLLETKDSELLEKIFKCLTRLFKFLRRYMVDDIKNVYRMYSSLLSDDNKEHIRRFAAESFAFLIHQLPDKPKAPDKKKAPEKPKFFKYMFRLVSANPEQVDGVGRLLFEVVKGVKKQFHSCTKQVLKLLFDCLKADENAEADIEIPLVEKALSQMLVLMLEHVDKEHAKAVEEAFCEYLLELEHSLKGNEQKIVELNQLSCILRLLNIWIDHKEAYFISCNSKLYQVLSSLCEIRNFLADGEEGLANVISSLLPAKYQEISVDVVKLLLNFVYTRDSKEIIISFTRKMFTYSMFEKDVLPHILSYCLRVINRESCDQDVVLQIMSETVTNLRPWHDVLKDFKSFRKLQFHTPELNLELPESRTPVTLEKFFLEVLESSLKEGSSFLKMSDIWSCIVCIPHFRTLNAQKFGEVLLDLMAVYHNHLMTSKGSDTDEGLELATYILCQAYVSWICVVGTENMSNKFQATYFSELLSVHPSSPSALQMVCVFLSCLSDEERQESSYDLFSAVGTKLIQNLTSPFHLIRFLSLTILNHLEFPLPDSEEEHAEERRNVFDMCLQAENIPVGVQDYRGKLSWLRKLEFPYVKKNMPTAIQEQCLQACVHFLLGNLYINFSLMWQPVLDLLSTYAFGCTEVFWKVFKQHLYSVIDLTEKSNTGKSDFIYDESTGEESFFHSTAKMFYQHDEHPDIFNHRNLLWKGMGLFPTIVRQKNQDVVPLLFRYIESEVARVDTSMASSETVSGGHLKDIPLDEDGALSDEESDDEDEDAGIDLEAEDTSEIQPPSQKKQKLLEDDIDTPAVQDEPSVVESEKTSDVDESFQDSITMEDVTLVDATETSRVDSGKPEADSSIVENENSEVDTALKGTEAFQMKSEKTDKGELGCKQNDTAVATTRKRKRGDASSSFKKRRLVIKTLASMLSLFSKFKKPKTLHKSEELQKLYYELLCYPDSEIQKLSFDCIMAYNFDFLVPYKDNIYKIIDEKTFKSEIVLFNVDKDNEIIQENHRIGTLSILMRILYGKMLSKTGNSSSGKTHSQTRKTLVLRFLAGCKEEELKMFLELVFAPFKEQLNGNVLSVVQNIRKSIDLTAVVPIKRMRSTLNTLEVILYNLGCLVPDLLPWFLKVLLAIAATATSLLEKREDLLPHCLVLIKSVRKQAIMRLIQFFKSFDHYEFTREEIDAVFEGVVWPALPRFQFEALNVPPPLLRLFDTWCSNSRFFILMAKHHPSMKSLSPLPRLMALYNSTHVRPRVVGLISKMILQLLTLKDVSEIESEEMNLPPLKINDCLPLSNIPETEDKEHPSLGMQLLFPHVQSILKRLQSIIVKAAKNAKRSLDSRELNILLRISCYVDDGHQCRQLINLLIPFFSRQKQKLSTDCEVLLLSTIRSLVRHVEKPTVFISSLAPLFSTLSSQRSRTALIAVVRAIADKDETVQELAEIVRKINAWNPDMMEEPDYQSRLDGHREALNIVRGNLEQMDINFNRIIIFNSSFMIRTCDDMALRDSASYLLKQLTKAYADAKIAETKPAMFKCFVFDTLLPEIRDGLHNKIEAVRSEFIRVLAALLHNCGHHHRLCHLTQLCDKDQDMDFWENILHLQVHRRARALLRFSNQLNDGTVEMHQHFLMTYMIPIVSSFLFDSAYQKHIHVVDAAVETMGTIAKHLPWMQYENLLRHYLGMLLKNSEHHKTVVKVVVAILNAFHFDLSKSKGVWWTGKKLLPKHATDDTPEEMKGDQDAKDHAQDDGLVDDVDQGEISTTSEVADALEGNSEVVRREKAEIEEEKATKIHRVIVRNILPQLQKSLMHKAKSDDEHKLAGKSYPEDDEILRVPIALAVVKLLQNLPHESLKKNIPGLFLRMCHLLKSRSESIRETARDTLIKMMQSLGPHYFPYLLKEMRGVMKRGYQVHVMTFTVNAILVNLTEKLKSGDLDDALSDLTEICMNEMFGDVAEEKEVEKITAKLKEARSNKSYNLFGILGRFISESLLGSLLLPLTEALNTARSHKAVKKIQECLRHVALGIIDNDGITVKATLIFIYAILKENLPQLNIQKKPSQSSKGSTYVRPDIYLIPKEPGRGGPPAKTAVKANVHVLVDFSLQILYLCLKRDKLTSSEKEHSEMLDPFIPFLADCLDSDHIKVISSTLRSLIWVFKFSLPSLKEKALHIVNSSFVLINKYAGVGMGQGENFEMVVMCFKMLTVMVRDTEYHTLTKDQLRVLLSYVEQDIHDHTRQAVAFTLLKAILSKKLQAAELVGIMNKISEMSIMSEQDHIRTQCRQVSLQYITTYALGKRLQNSLNFFVNQLEYVYENGRLSAIEMINSLLHAFSIDVVKKHAGLFLVPLAARLVNDESSLCRKMAAQTIKNLLRKVDHDDRSNLFSISLTWLESKKLSHRRLGTQLCGIFAEVEKERFHRYLKDVLPLFSKNLKDEEKNETSSQSQVDERCTDHYLFHLLNALIKILMHCKVIREATFSSEMDTIWENLQGLILYPHVWVRLAVSQLYGLAFSAFEDVEEVVEAVSLEDEGKTSNIFFASRQKLRDLSADFATQLQSPYLNEALGDQVVKNMVYLSKVISGLSDNSISPLEKKKMKKKEIDDGESNESKITEVSLFWIIRKLCKEARKEVARSPQTSIKRNCLFKYLAAISISIELDKLKPLLPDILTPLCRELADSSPRADESLKSLAQEVLNIVKNAMGIEEYTRVYAIVQTSLHKKKALRKQEKVKEAVTNPEKFAKKKIKKQLNKKEAKKRKIFEKKGKKKTKRLKLSQMAIES